VAEPDLTLRLLGPLALGRGGTALRLPPSRKARALLAYLALAPHPVSRSHLCELLWDLPADPRGELRWSLSKLRRLVDAPGRQRLRTDGDSVSLDLAGCRVDALEVAAAADAGLEGLPAGHLRHLADLFGGDFLDGLEIDRSPPFTAWLLGQRRRYGARRIAILERLAAAAGDDASALAHLESWLALAPLDLRAHSLLLGALARLGRVAEGDRHVAAAVRAFEADGLDSGPLHLAWRAAKLTRPGRAGPVTVGGAAAAADETAATGRRASIAVLPFLDQLAGGHQPGGLADGLVSDVITRLAKLRSLFVIAQGTAFELRDRQREPAAAARSLGVDYAVGGAVRRHGDRLRTGVELIEVRTARILWAETYDRRVDDALLVLEEIGNCIVASVASQVDMAERNRAILRPPNSLTAWEAYHRGTWHAYRYNRQDNERALHFLGKAAQLDPTFARAHAALSFAHFQNAFLRWGEREREMDLAFEAAGQGLMIDDLDPAPHWAMGRALWLRGQQDEALRELRTAVDLSPSFAHGHYTLAFVNAQTGDASSAIGSSDHSRSLSPYDPLLFAMLATRAMALARLGRIEEAAEWAARSALRPNAFPHIRALAACLLAVAERLGDARAVVASIGPEASHYRIDGLLGTFRFTPEMIALLRRGAGRLGID
jgi:DNA-binding SARP family transcriptional activator/TolB-like protein